MIKINQSHHAISGPTLSSYCMGRHCPELTRTTVLEEFLVVVWLKSLKEQAFTHNHVSLPFAYKVNQMQVCTL